MLYECNSQPEWSPGHEKGMAKKRDAQPEDNVLALETFVINTDLIPIKKNLKKRKETVTSQHILYPLKSFTVVMLDGENLM